MDQVANDSASESDRFPPRQKCFSTKRMTCLAMGVCKFRKHNSSERSPANLECWPLPRRNAIYWVQYLTQSKKINHCFNNLSVIIQPQLICSLQHIWDIHNVYDKCSIHRSKLIYNICLSRQMPNCPLHKSSLRRLICRPSIRKRETQKNKTRDRFSSQITTKTFVFAPNYVVTLKTSLRCLCRTLKVQSFMSNLGLSDVMNTR